MAIIQALFALISRSAGKILNAIFGWAVHALFGRTTSRDATMLSALVAAAAAWPLLLAGIAAPKVAALALAFVPLPHWVPSWTVRLVWIALALAVPVTLGLVLGARRPSNLRHEPYVTRVLRGFPVTLGLALAFLIMFVSVPVIRLVALVRRQRSADVPLVTDVSSYHEVAALIVDALKKHGLELRSSEPSWWVTAPMRLLGWFGGDAFSGFVPSKIEHFTSKGLDLSFYTSGILLRGEPPRVTWAHGLIAETAVHSGGLETMTAPAQELERELRRLWKVVEGAPAAHGPVASSLGRVHDLARELGTIEVDYEEWSVLYRQLLQVERAVRGQRQLLDESSTSAPEAKMHETPNETPNQTPKDLPSPRAPAESLSTPELVGEIVRQAQSLVTAQVELAKAELRADLAREYKMVAGLGAAALAGLIAVTLLFVTAILALSAVLPAWLAGLAVTGVMLVVTGIVAAVGWGKRVRVPLARTRHEIDQEVKLIKERAA